MSVKTANAALKALRQKAGGKVVTAEQAVALIRDGDTLATSGFACNCFSEEIAIALENRFLAEKSPRDLTLLFGAGQAFNDDRGLNRWAHEGMIKRFVGGHYGLAQKVQRLALENLAEVYNLPQGVMVHLFRDIAAGNPGTLTTVGLGTFVDPRFGGGKINARTTEDIVKLIEIEGKEYLLYKGRPIDVSIIRGTTADSDGNISLEHEVLDLEMLPVAMAARNSGGIVIAQVERLASKGSLPCRSVKIPGILVDLVVVAAPEHHWQTAGTRYNGAFSGEFRVPMGSLPAMEMSERKIIARRAAMELTPESVVNLGIGMPEGVANIAAEEGIGEMFTLTAESGLIGGIPQGGPDFGAGVNMDAILDEAYQFDFYEGGGVDVAFLGLAQADRDGNLNVSKFGPKLAGCGGFIDISQNAKKVVYVGTFKAGGLQVAIKDGTLQILKEGKVKKLVGEIEQRTFSGAEAVRRGQPVLFITERCVFRLTEEGLELTEVAPGVDIEKDILAQMDFKPVIKGAVPLMDARIFQDSPMGLKKDLLG